MRDVYIIIQSVITRARITRGRSIDARLGGRTKIEKEQNTHERGDKKNTGENQWEREATAIASATRNAMLMSSSVLRVLVERSAGGETGRARIGGQERSIGNRFV